MFREKQQEDFSSNLVREAKINRKNNRVFILTVSKKKNQWEKKETDQKKLANYILKKQILREQIQQKATSPGHTEISHRSNIDRLINLISKSRTSNKNSESGCQKMVKALLKVNSKLGTFVCLKQAFESLKRYTMTCSSNNYELFLQSRHLNFRQSQKVPENNKDFQQSLQKIAEYAQEYHIKNEHSGLSISKDLNNESWKQQFIPYNQVTSSNRKIETTPKNKMESAANLTTRQELMSHQNFPSPAKDLNATVKPSKSIELNLPSKSSKINVDLQGIQPAAFSQKVPSPLSEVQKDKLAFTFCEKQQTQLTLNQLKNQIQQCGSKRTPALQQKKSNSPILSLMFAIPTDMTQKKEKEQIGSAKLVSKITPKQLQRHWEKKPVPVKNQNKKEQVLTPNQYAQLMLFGTPQTAEQKVSKEYRNFLQQKSRKRVSSLPKITFTYVSRQKYEAENKAVVQKNPITSPKHLQNQSISKNSSKQDLHSTFQSKQNIQKPRQNVMMTQNPSQYEQQMKNSGSRQKLVVMHQPFGSSKVVRNEYYGDPYQMNRHLPQTLQMKRERILTAQPSWEKQVQFVGIQQQMPGCCWQQKEVRSRSLNQRVLVRANSQNNIVFR